MIIHMFGRGRGYFQPCHFLPRRRLDAGSRLYLCACLCADMCLCAYPGLWVCGRHADGGGGVGARFPRQRGRSCHANRNNSNSCASSSDRHIQPRHCQRGHLWLAQLVLSLLASVKVKQASRLSWRQISAAFQNVSLWRFCPSFECEDYKVRGACWLSVMLICWLLLKI